MTGRTRYGPNVVDTEQLYDACVTTAKIATDGVETANIKDDAVTSDKVAPGVLTQHVRNMVAYAAIAHGTATTPIATIPAGSTITGVIVSITQAYNGSAAAPTINIGVSGDHNSLLDDASITKTLNAISGEDPATCGVDIWVPGVQTTTASDWALSALHVDGTSHNMDTHTQGSTAGDYTVTTYGHQRVKYLAADTIYNAYITAAGSGGTTGTADVFIMYNRVVMAD